MDKSGFSHELVAPCGMNCGICSGYLAYSRNIPKKRGKIVHCIGCRPRDKQCAYLKGRCAELRDGKVRYCFECKDFPCERLKHLDERYRKNYNMSMIENLEMIKEVGIKKFLENERKRWRCPKCGGVICVHNGKCYDCEHIESWKG
jgi:hypothetical protein